MATVKRTTIGEILSAIRARLVFKSVVPNAGHVIILAKRQPPPPANVSKDILLRVGNARFDWDTGGGRWAAKKVVTVGVYARLQMALDKGLTDEKWLTAQEVFENSVYNALLDWLPLDSAENSLVTEPLHLVTAQAPEKQGDDILGDSLMTFEVHYQPDGIDPTDAAAT